MRRLLAAALVTKGRCSRSLGWSGTRGSTTVSAVVHVAGRSAGHAGPGCAFDIFLENGAVNGAAGSACSCCNRRRGGDLRRRLKPHRRSSTLRVSPSQRGSGIGRRRPTFRLFHRGRRWCVGRRRFARSRCRAAPASEPDIIRGSTGFAGARPAFA